MVLVAGLLVAWWATNAKQISTAFGENVWLLGLFVAGGLPTGDDIVLCEGSRGYLLHRRRVEKKGSRTM